jgi:tRNA(Ile)-lysidine synthase TilS/MesJ
MLKRCSKCILPETYPGITFDEQGVCNHCLTQRRSSKRRGEAALMKLLESHPNGHNREYDCMLGLSGGRDSTFAAYYLTKALNLKVLAYTADNGFIPEQTRQNIKKTVDLLGMDHVVKKHSMKKKVRHVVASWIRRPSPAMISFVCTGCQTGYLKGLTQTARNHGSLPIITGEGEPEQSFAQRLLSPNRSKGKKLPLVLGFVTEMIKNPLYALSPGCLFEFVDEFLHRFLHKGEKDLLMLQLFKYIVWDEEQVLTVIQDELGWKNPSFSKSSWRSDCEINFLRNYLFQETLGFTKNDELLSGMVRMNMITREQALQRAHSENVMPQKPLIALFDKLGLDFQRMHTALKNYKQNGQQTHVENESGG